MPVGGFALANADASLLEGVNNRRNRENVPKEPGNKVEAGRVNSKRPRQSIASATFVAVVRYGLKGRGSVTWSLGHVMSCWMDQLRARARNSRLRDMSRNWRSDVRTDCEPRLTIQEFGCEQYWAQAQYLELSVFGFPINDGVSKSDALRNPPLLVTRHKSHVKSPRLISARRCQTTGRRRTVEIRNQGSRVARRDVHVRLTSTPPTLSSSPPVLVAGFAVTKSWDWWPASTSCRSRWLSSTMASAAWSSAATGRASRSMRRRSSARFTRRVRRCAATSSAAAGFAAMCWCAPRRGRPQLRHAQALVHAEARSSPSKPSRTVVAWEFSPRALRLRVRPEWLSA